MMDSMNTWLHDKRKSFEKARSTSMGNIQQQRSSEIVVSAVAKTNNNTIKRRPASKSTHVSTRKNRTPGMTSSLSRRRVQSSSSKTSSKSRSESHRKSSSSSNRNRNRSKRKGRRPTKTIKEGNEENEGEEAAELNRMKQEHGDDSDYQDSDGDDYDDCKTSSTDDEFELRVVVEDEDVSSIEDEDDIEEEEEVLDTESVYTTITVETVRTKENENRKPLGPIFGGYFTKDKQQNSTQIIVNAIDPVTDLKNAMNDITKLSIFFKKVHIDQEVAKNFLALVRGDGRSWEAIAVDILRQKARWDSIVLEECTSKNDEHNIQNDDNEDYLDLLLAHILAVDNCAYLHLSNYVWTNHTAWTMQSMMFCKSLNKLQLDLVDLTFAVPMLSRGLRDNKSLKCLITSRCGLLDEPLGELLGNLPEQLEEIRIFGNKCRAKGLASITSALAKKTTCLKILDLSYQHVGPDEEFDVQYLADAISRNKTLKTLDVDNDSLDDGHLSHIVEALTKNRTLEELMLNHNKITGTGVAMLAAKFGEMKGLKKISMYSNVFDSEPSNDSS